MKRLKLLLLLSLSHYGDKARLTPRNAAVNHRLLAGRGWNICTNVFYDFLWPEHLYPREFRSAAGIQTTKKKGRIVTIMANMLEKGGKCSV